MFASNWQTQAREIRAIAQTDFKLANIISVLIAALSAFELTKEQIVSI
jgi:ABC-type lipoprotein release transport system permease subunit